MEKITKKYPYLRGLPIESYENAEPGILIGANCWKLAVPIKTREGHWLEPIATKCRLGWTLQGGTTNHFDSQLLNIHICDCEKKYEILHEEIKEYFSLEMPQKRELMSPQDCRALQILNSTCEKREGRYEVGLLWKHDDAKLPASYDNALKRFRCMQKKLAKDSNLQRDMQKQIDNLISKGYARRLTADEVNRSYDHEWYLPIFITLNPNKPGKLRLVWDAAAKSDGAALNDFLLCGPDLLNSLVFVLLAFRTGQFAICGDIAEMFHQIRVREMDMHAQRFLWHENCEELHNPHIYVMQALTFGISCAPCIAHFVRDVNAEQYKQTSPRAVEAIQKHHYVDDFIDSVDTEEEALELALQVKAIHAQAGFNIRNWASNSSAVLRQLPGESVEDQTPKDLSNAEKILGLFWDPTNDVFKFICRFSKMRRDILQCSLVPTKREVLQVLMSIFDPLGFVAHYTIGLKILLQDVWRSAINWDDPLPGPLYNKWCQWKTLLPAITSITIPRCYSQLLKDSECNQIHTFVDAGEYAYAAICYLRVKNKNGVNTIIVAAKSKVAPLKPVSIPRLELQAAVTGVRLANNVMKALQFPIHARFWWSDSKTVLKWLRMDPRNFKQYVMHRVGEVLEATNATDWNWVPSKINPAGLATKFSRQQSSDIWLHGPKFLSFNQTDWPKCDDLGPVEHTELRHFTFHITKGETTQPLIDADTFSSWRRLYLTMAMVILFVEKLKSKIKKEQIPTGVCDKIIHRAKSALIKEAQQSGYRQEVINLKCGKSIESDSKLISLNVYLSDEGILRSRGRAESLRTDDSIILPTNNSITALIVRHYHERNHHQFHEAALNSIREQYYIPRLRVLYRKIRRSCQRCKNDGAKPNTQQMAPLPAAHETLKSALCEVELTINSRPLTFVYLDSADDDALTPNHLLLGSTDGHKSVFNEASNLRQQWHKTQDFANKFWQRWLQEYTPIIQRRAKWFSKRASVAIGDVVVVVDETLPRNYWPKGIIVDVVKAKDEQVRRVTIKTQKGLMQRPATKVAVLDVTGNT
ncbi:uncharacterized protein LOC118757122 [Rhagoletis pomonella]|uniref:uncharacterized protein LOC118757122 n=1 Tax=Rhagoletis pomonella TaxID=28610 RepID=UPI00177D4C25|nr:uncharacterized protein LOC118757122 [Rhagoletis pomonella]